MLIRQAGSFNVAAGPHYGPTVLAGGGLVLAAAIAIAALTVSGPLYVVVALAAYLPVAIGVWLAAPRAHPHPTFGLANGITLFRAGLACLAAGLIAAPDALAVPLNQWVLVTGIALTLALDLVDGWIARHQHLVSAFGARFDMEVDAWLVLILAGVALTQGAAPVWVLAIGLARYLFIAAGMVLPALAAPLPPSLRRRLICGLQVIALGAVLAPPFPAIASGALIGSALAALMLSFALDIRWLIRQSRR